MGSAYATSQVESPLGVLRLAATRDGLARICLPRESGAGFTGWLARALGGAERVDWLPLLDKARQEIEAYFAGRLRAFALPLDLRGTPFQRSVWNALLQIPYGETRSYAEVARAIDRPLAVRAVGSANGANPLPLIVPCHRVISADGKLGGYGGGADAKRRLLALEKAASASDLL